MTAAVIFFLGAAVIGKLYFLQVVDHDLYAALAQSQHQAEKALEPDRGSIFVQDSQALMGGRMYPIATNKDFALVFAIPEEVMDIDGTAQILYELFDRENVVEEVEEALEEDEYFKSLFDEELKKELTGEEYEKIKDLYDIKRELEIKAREKEALEGYAAKFKKRKDPYEPLKRKVDENKLNELLARDLPGIYHFMETFRYYPEGDVGAHLSGFVGYYEDGMRGLYGLEGFFDTELTGKMGHVKTERSAGGNLIIIKDREYIAPINGVDLVLTINRSIQFEVCGELKDSVERYDADSGTVIVMEPNTGAIVAMCSEPAFDPNNYNEEEDINVFNNPAVFEAYEPGSIFKVFTMAAGLDQGEITPESTYEDKGFIMIEGWPKPIKNSDYDSRGGHGVVNMITVLEESLNTGSIHVMESVGAEKFAEYVKNFGFGEKTGIELETEGPTNIQSLTRSYIRPVEAATASFGQGITATPLQLVTAYSAIANGGYLMKPYVVGEMVYPDGKRETTRPREIRRVISERTALLLSGMMVKVVDGGHAKLAEVPGYFVAGKTGTAQVASREARGYGGETIHTFVGFAPVDEPKFVMLVKFKNPKKVTYAASSAAPAFGRLAEFILNYYQVPKER